MIPIDKASVFEGQTRISTLLNVRQCPITISNWEWQKCIVLYFQKSVHQKKQKKQKTYKQQFVS